MGYHKRTIKRGKTGEASKIMEEAEEFIDAIEQDVTLMGLIELSDLYGAMDAYLKKHHPSVSMDDLAKMAALTKKVFEEGHRQERAE